MGISERTITKSLIKLEMLNFIVRENYLHLKAIFINPIYVTMIPKDSLLSDDLFKMFDESKEDIAIENYNMSRKRTNKETNLWA